MKHLKHLIKKELKTRLKGKKLRSRPTSMAVEFKLILWSEFFLWKKNFSIFRSFSLTQHIV